MTRVLLAILAATGCEKAGAVERDHVAEPDIRLAEVPPPRPAPPPPSPPRTIHPDPDLGPPPPPPAPPQNIPPSLLESQRIAGDKNIVPDDDTKILIQQSGKDKVVGAFKLCIDTSGTPTAVNRLKSTGFPDYDAKLEAAMKEWRYRPYLVNGKSAPVCTAVTFIYTQR